MRHCCRVRAVLGVNIACAGRVGESDGVQAGRSPGSCSKKAGMVSPYPPYKLAIRLHQVVQRTFTPKLPHMPGKPKRRADGGPSAREKQAHNCTIYVSWNTNARMTLTTSTKIIQNPTAIFMRLKNRFLLGLCSLLLCCSAASLPFIELKRLSTNFSRNDGVYIPFFQNRQPFLNRYIPKNKLNIIEKRTSPNGVFSSMTTPRITVSLLISGTRFHKLIPERTK